MKTFSDMAIAILMGIAVGTMWSLCGDAAGAASAVALLYHTIHDTATN